MTPDDRPSLSVRLAQVAALLDAGDAEAASVELAAAAASCAGPGAPRLAPAEAAEAERQLQRCTAAEAQLRRSVVRALAGNGVLRRLRAAYGQEA